MSLLFIDGMDHYSSAQIGSKWSSSGLTYSTTGGRFGGGALLSGTGNFLTQAIKDITQSGTFIIGFAYKTSGFADKSVVRFYDGVSLQCELCTNGLGRWIIKCGGSQVGTASVTVLTPGVWNFIEWKVTITSSTGANQCVVRMNNVEILNLTGISTKTSANTTANLLGFGDTSFSSATMTFDDLYICNNSGSVNNDFLGDCRIETLYPNGAGNYTDFGLNGAATNWQAVSEARADDVTSYVASDVPGDIDTYTFTNPAGTLATVYGIQPVLRGRKDNAGARTFANVLRIGGTDYTGVAFSLSTDYLFYCEVIENNPDTVAPWTSSDIIALESGVTVVS